MSPDTVEFASCKPAGILSGASCSADGKATHAAGAHFCHIDLRRSPCLGLNSPPVRDVREDADAEGLRAVLPECSMLRRQSGEGQMGICAFAYSMPAAIAHLCTCTADRIAPLVPFIGNHP